MSERRQILLTPGPVTLSEAVRTALGSDPVSHREPEFAELTRDINERLVRVYREMPKDFRSVIMTGSGTSAVEAMLASFAPTDATTLVLANGVSGERIATMLELQGKPFVTVASEWLQPIDMAAVQAALNNHPDISHVVAVHHETTTGRLNDLAALGELCVEHDLKLMLDCVGSFGVEAIEADKWNIAALAGSAGKCLHGVPGVSFVLARRQLWSAKQVAPASVYLDLHAYYAGQHGGGFSPFTQAAQPAFALREALRELEDHGGWEQRRSIYRVRAGHVAVLLKKLGLETLLPPQDFSCVLWTWKLPEGDTFKRVHKFMKEQGFTIGAAQGDLAEQVFRLAHMGDIQNNDLARLEIALGKCFAADKYASVTRI